MDSARKHGIDDADIEHALRNWIASHNLNDIQNRPLTMYVGPDWSGALLEVGVNCQGDVVHAMPVRRKFLPRTKR